jgi:hypothetical protein
VSFCQLCCYRSTYTPGVPSSSSDMSSSSGGGSSSISHHDHNCCLLLVWPLTSGLAVELSERPLLCVAAHWEAAEVVLGGSDHALYVIDVRSGRKKRTLYTKACGHTE